MTNKPEVTQADTFPVPEHGFTCFHCGETFKTVGGARNHFGFEPSADPACRIKVGAERGLVMELRKAEQALADAWVIIHDDGSDIAKAMAAQATRHGAQMMDAEEAGYARGLGDGREEAAAAQAENAGLREELKKAKNPRWFYYGDECSSERCRFSIGECIEEDFLYENSAEGDHVLCISGARPVPDIWVALRFFTEEEKDARDSDDLYAFTEHATEEEAHQALTKENQDD